MIRCLQRDVAVLTAAGRGGGVCLGEPPTCPPRRNHLIEHADRHRAVDTARDACVLRNQAAPQRVASVADDERDASAPITAISASGQAKTAVAPSEREFMAI